MQITIDNNQVAGLSNLSNFPVLINVSDGDLRNVTNNGMVENINGDDFRFTSSDMTTLLDFEIESYDESTGTLIAWVKVPVLDYNDDTNLFLYFGNSSASDYPNPENTWSSNYVGVWHLHDDFDDATSLSLNGINNGSSDIIGKIADGQSFSEVGPDYIDLSNPAALNFGAGNWTLSSWITTTANGQRNIFSNGGDNANGIRYVMALGENGLDGMATITVDDNTSAPPKYQAQAEVPSLPSNDGAWHHVSAVRTGSTIRIYVDGIEEDLNNNLPVGYDLSGTSQRNAYIGVGVSQPTG
ncbi:MAG: DUF2341 domain-containing protein, partial [Candidatus Cloacimonadota bacterium]|nr:DUF2341 domain-containing protein [Candidatus Cloacimonadota bacterium]